MADPALPAYATLIDPALGDPLGASAVNGYVKNALYLHGQAAGGYEPFTGFSGTPVGSQEVWRGYFVYRGAFSQKIYNNISGTGAVIGVSTDGASINPTIANPIDISAGSFTVGKKYWLSLTCGAGQATKIDYAYVPTSNAGTYSAPSGPTDGNLSAVADFTQWNSAEAYLQKLVEVPSGTFRGVSFTTPFPPSGSFLVWNGSFVYLGLNTINITFNNTTTAWDESVLELHIQDNIGDQTVAHSTSAVPNSFPSTVDISGLSLTLGSIYRMWALVTRSSGTSRSAAAIQRLFFSGSSALTNAPQLWSVNDYGYATSGANRLKYVSDALATIKTLGKVQTISGVDYGIQYLSSNLLSVVLAPTTATVLGGLDFRRIRHWRWLMYKPTGVGKDGTLTYGLATAKLPDVNGDGSWTAFDLSTLVLLPPGFTYKVTDVEACFESPTST